MLTRDEAQKLAQTILKLSTFPECQVTIAASEQAYTRFANNGITTASLNLRHSVSIAVTRDSRSGAMTVNDLDGTSLRAAVKKHQTGIVPLRQTREDLGYTSEQIKLMEDEDQKAVDVQNAAVFGQPKPAVAPQPPVAA